MQFSTLTIAAVTVCLAGRPAAAQETASDTLLTVKHYLNFEGVADPRLSPDGRQIVYTRRWVNKQEDKWDTALWIMNAATNSAMKESAVRLSWNACTMFSTCRVRPCGGSTPSPRGRRSRSAAAAASIPRGATSNCTASSLPTRPKDSCAYS